MRVTPFLVPLCLLLTGTAPNPVPLSGNGSLAPFLALAMERNKGVQRAYLEWKLQEQVASESTMIPEHHQRVNPGIAKDEEESFAKIKYHTQMVEAESNAAQQRYLTARLKLRQNVLSNLAEYHFATRAMELSRRQRQLTEILTDSSHGSYASGTLASDDLRNTLLQRRRMEEQLAGDQAMRDAALRKLQSLIDGSCPGQLPIPEPSETDSAFLPTNAEIRELQFDLQRQEASLAMARLHENQSLQGIVAGLRSASMAQALAGSQEATLRVSVARAALAQKQSEQAAEAAAIKQRLTESRRRWQLRIWLPQAQEACQVAQAAYACGMTPLSRCVQTRMEMLDLERKVARAKADLIMAQAELETLGGGDENGR